MKRNTRILILDDDRDVCRLYFAALAREGREILTASSAHSGLHSAALYAPDILLVDIGLRSGPDGFSFLEKWAAQYNKGGRVVMISGRDDPESMERARWLGVAGYLVKPVSPQALESVVASLESELVVGERMDSVEDAEGGGIRKIA